MTSSRGRSLLVALAFGATIAGCKADPGADASDAGADAGRPAPSADEERVAAIVRAEHRRSSAEITPADGQSRSVAVRRAAARALARIGGEEARAGLLRALGDEDREVVAWASYGLGFSCKGREKETVSALVARALSLGDSAAPREGAAADGGADAGPGDGRARLDARTAIARAVGRCASEESEPTLVAWLAGSPEEAAAAALALGDLVAVRGRLREETLAALLHLASGSASVPPAPEGLFPIGRLERVPLTVTARLREVATARLAEPGERRLFAVRALGRAGPEAAAELGRVISSPSLFTAAERGEAARALRLLGAAGQRALADVLPSLAPPSDPVALTAMGEELGVLLAVLDTLSEPGKARKTLQGLAALPPPPNAPATLLRRLSWIRCGAATILAGSDTREPHLAPCDLTGAAPADGADAGAAPPGQPGSIGARAMVKVLGRAPIEGARLSAFLAHARRGDLRAREAAIELLGTHEELQDEAAPILAEALASPQEGLAATAAEVIAKKPELAGEAPKRKKRKKKRADAEREEEAPRLPPSPAIVKAIVAAVGRADAENSPEMLGTAIDAAGALGLKETLPRLEELCRSPWPTTREHAGKAIGLISGKTPTCTAPPGGGPLPPELNAPATGEVTITLDTDGGQMTLVLDATIAPGAVTRIVDLARAGYYDGVVVHRIVPGFVTQLGAPHGDGYGGPQGKAPLRCETSPVAFDPLTVGIALSGRDTGSSQFFVMHGRHPHLDGQYAWIGRATGPWAAFVDGDLVRKASVSP
ncbi:peptidylprolyl isomerase [Polyangium aurulentum]|uniref:peptidylprolyl isomerase n=1 Tax=Polyangium aurulentum TaxID=2567896 RepID=UPI0010AEB7AC|nr:peptidylprolyl isomerase [Polyangium aurulentum]UQA59525.1 peptidylprolyl isomerase [Polyangium aurulentum]